MPSLDLSAPHLIKDAGKILREIEKLECEESLVDYVRLLWHILEPARPYVHGWHIDAICEHLQAVTDGELRRLLINVPPGFAKSLLTNVFWPSWEWGPRNLPSFRYVSASYSEKLTVRDNLRCRNLVRSDIYRSYWGDRFGISDEQFTKIKFANDKTGWKLATSVDGLGTGERGDRFIIDDPHNVKQAESDAVRESTLMWFSEVVPTRLNDPETSAIVCIMQRVHEEDVSGYILSRELGWDHLMIPMEFDPVNLKTCVTRIGWEDPRQYPGELAWPERYPAHVVEELKTAMGSYATAGQFQQSPMPRGGGIFKQTWWELWPPADWPETSIPKIGDQVAYPEMEYVVASVDTALTEDEENDYSACTVWGVWHDDRGAPKLMLIAAWQEKLEFRPLVEKIIQTCRARRVDRLLVEAKANGMSVAQEIVRLCSGEEFGVTLNNPKGDKVARAYSVQHVFEAGLVYAPDKRWASMVMDQMSVFPRGANDDLVDSCVQAVKHLRDRGLAQFNDEREAELRSRFGPPGERKRLPYDV